MKKMKQMVRVRSAADGKGFTLILTLSMMVLLALIAVGLLSLSTVTLRTATVTKAVSEARANARMAMLIALGELQLEMGPDMRISAKSSLLDNNKDTDKIDGVAQPHWLASFDSWGTWLNGKYTRPNGGGPLSIQDTYNNFRSNMFRRWLVSMPPSMTNSIQSPVSTGVMDESNSVTMVGEGSLGNSTNQNPESVTRAFLLPIGNKGRHAWWISPENHKAVIHKAKAQRSLSADSWQASQGTTGEVGIGAVNGFTALDNDPSLADRLVSFETLESAGVDQEIAKSKFFDLTRHGKGVITNVRTGQLKKDLSLLFELNTMPAPYAFSTGQIQEPSIRPMTEELLAKAPKIINRHFASWTNMRHYYRMYRSQSDATIGEMGGNGSLAYNRSVPITDCSASVSLGSATSQSWDGSNNYWRMPILAKITFIYSLVAEPDSRQPGKFNCFHVYSPVFTLWNPYNVQLRIPDNTISYLTSAYKVWPNSGEFWLGSNRIKNADEMGKFGQFGHSQGLNVQTTLSSGSGGDIIFQPGEFRVFSHANTVTNAATMVPGFNPQAIGGEKKLYGSYRPSELPGVKIQFSHNYWGGNINYGNTTGSLCMLAWWNRSSNPGGIPQNYAHDWFDKSQRTTPITLPSDTDVVRWNFSDRLPQPVAFAQLVVKGISQYNYESINWASDWRSRNWIQAPPFYFGSGMYVSENQSIANTQRMDNPYMVFFGPMSMAEMPKVVGQVGTRSLLGSGSNPFEKITSASMLELPTAPISSMMSFAGMRINPGWTRPDSLSSNLRVPHYGGAGVTSTGEESLHAAETKRVAYQSGVTGTGIGNSFMHPMLRRDDVYQFFNNSVSEDMPNRETPNVTITRNTDAYCDYWDHALLLNDALFDEFYISTLSDQTRNNAQSAISLNSNISRLTSGEAIANNRYEYHSGGKLPQSVNADLLAQDGYLKAAKHMMVEGMFNVNSTSLDAWYSLFCGIRERQLVFRDGGNVQTVQIPTGKRIAISRFDTEISNKEMTSVEYGVTTAGGNAAWSGLRFLSDVQLRKLAEQCVRQVKLRGPFLNFSEFINRRLATNELGLMGAIQSAIDFDDASPDPDSINYKYKTGGDFMIAKGGLGRTNFQTPEAAEGSRFAGIPGYVIQSDILKPISNNLSVRDDTFLIRSYGESLDSSGNIQARAWCEVIVQRVPEYIDPVNEAHLPARQLLADGTFSDIANSALTPINMRFGRKFRIESFRWLNPSEV